MSMSVRTKVAFAGCFCVFVGVTAYFIYIYRIRRAATIRSRRIEEAAARFYTELLAQHERDRAARAAAEDEEAEEEDLADLDQRIPFLVSFPDKSLHVALLDEELSHLAPGAVHAVKTVQLPTRPVPADARGERAAPTQRADEDAAGPVELPTAFIAPPSGNLSPPAPPQPGPDTAELLPASPGASAAARREPPPPPAAVPAPDALQRSESAAAERETMSQRLWRLGSAVFSAAPDAPDNDIPPNVVWSTVSVPAALLPAAFHPATERSSTLRGSLWRPSRSFHQLSGVLGLARAESAGSSRSFFGRSQTETLDNNALYLPMGVHPEEDVSVDESEEESAGIAADYPEGTWPESASPRLHGVSGRFQRADSARSLSRRGSASGRLASLSKTLSQALSMPGGPDRRDRYTTAAAASARLPGTPNTTAEANGVDGPLHPPHSIAVALPVM